MPPAVIPWFVAVALPGWAHSARTLGRLAAWCLRFTPRVHVEHADPGAGAGPPVVLLDAGGCLRVNGGAGRIVARIRRGLGRRGIAHAVGSAPSSGEAVVRAMAAALGCGDADRLAVDALPVECLRLPEAACASLREVNILRIGEARAVARASLGDRLGPQAGERLDMASGLRPWPFVPIRPPDRVAGAFRFASPCAQPEAVRQAARQAVDELCAVLAGRDRGVRALEVRFGRARLPTVAGTVHFGAPTRDPHHVWTILRPRVERLHLGEHELGQGIERIELVATRLGRCAGGTPLLAGPVGAAAADAGADGASGDRRASTERAVGELVDQLCARLGDRGVRRPEP